MLSGGRAWCGCGWKTMVLASLRNIINVFSAHFRDYTPMNIRARALDWRLCKKGWSKWAAEQEWNLNWEKGAVFGLSCPGTCLAQTGLGKRRRERPEDGGGRQKKLHSEKV